MTEKMTSERDGGQRNAREGVLDTLWRKEKARTYKSREKKKKTLLEAYTRYLKTGRTT